MNSNHVWLPLRPRPQTEPNYRIVDLWYAPIIPPVGGIDYYRDLHTIDVETKRIDSEIGDCTICLHAIAPPSLEVGSVAIPTFSNAPSSLRSVALPTFSDAPSPLPEVGSVAITTFSNAPSSLRSEEDHSEEGLYVKLNCSHCFHARCIKEWGKQNPSCPVCRRAIPRVIVPLP